jgi:hypothetical protein
MIVKFRGTSRMSPTSSKLRYARTVCAHPRRQRQVSSRMPLLCPDPDATRPHHHTTTPPHHHTTTPPHHHTTTPPHHHHHTTRRVVPVSRRPQLGPAASLRVPPLLRTRTRTRTRMMVTFPRAWRTARTALVQGTSSASMIAARKIFNGCPRSAANSA